MAAAYTLAAWYLYRYTGDASGYRDYFEPIRMWADEVAATAKDGLVGGIWADHVAPSIPPTGRHELIVAGGRISKAAAGQTP